MKILITGGTGFIGRALVRESIECGDNVTVLVRDLAKARFLLGAGPRLIRSLDELPVEESFDSVINLAGAGIADRRWTAARKQVLLDSRIQTTRHLVQWMERARQPPAMLLSASAVGFYGAGRSEPLTEQSPGQPEFAHELCQLWEQEARRAELSGVRVCLLRLGVVLGPGGMLGRLMPFYRFWLGGRLGDGRQMMSWIHRADVIRVIRWLQTHEGSGVYNLTAPHSATNRQFNDALAAALRRPALLSQPAFLVRLLFGEMGERLLLNGQQVLPQRLLDEGYEFLYPDLPSALQACLCDFRLN